MKTFFKLIIIKVLEWEARILLKRKKPKIIAVTGSVGKTSTTAAVYTALTPFTTVRKSEKSFNSEFGIPLTILGLPTGWNNPIKWINNIIDGMMQAFFSNEYPQYLVLEVGSDRPGDIDKVVKWLPVYMAVLTRFPETPVHVEFFKDGHAVNEEDKKILKGLSKEGIIIMNADDAEMKDIPSRFSNKIISYGISQDAAVRAENIKVTYAEEFPTGMQCEVAMMGKEISQKVPLAVSGSLGMQHIYPLLAALSVVEALNFDVSKAVPVLLGHESPKGRMRIIKGVHNSVIIDDTYNSSPVSVEEALNALETIETKGKKIAVLGDMLELGVYTEREHIRIGKKAAKILDSLITVGLRSQDFITGAAEAKMAKTKMHNFANAVTALNYIKKHVKENDIVLVKGSQGMRLEKVVKYLMADQDKAKDMLVRQEKEWEDR